MAEMSSWISVLGGMVMVVVVPVEVEAVGSGLVIVRVTLGDASDRGICGTGP